jgi:branched-chain amino acid transport system permease protein
MVLIIAIGLATGCVYAIVAMGFSLIFQTTGVVNFAQGAYVTLGAFVTYWLYQTGHVPYPLAILGGMAGCAIGGLTLWYVVIQPMWRMGAPPFTVLFSTIVYGAILGDGIELVFGTNPEALPDWWSGIGVHIAGGFIDGQYILVVAATVAIAAGFGAVLRYTNLGRAMRATAASRDTSQLLGISTERIGWIGMAGCAALSGLAGAMITPVQFAYYDSASTYGLFGITAAVMGGFTSLWGGLAGGLFLGVVYALVGRYVSSAYQDVIVFGLLFLTLMVRPQGLLGRGVAHVSHSA